MYHGDTLRAETRMLSKRLSGSRPGEGVVTLEHTGRNQDGVVTAVAVRAVMMRCRPEAEHHIVADPTDPTDEPGRPS